MTFRRHTDNPHERGTSDWYRHAYYLMKAVQNHTESEGIVL